MEVDGGGSEAVASTSSVDVGSDAVDWLSEDSGRRLQKLGSVACAKLTASKDDGKVSVELLDGAAGGNAWAEFCVRAVCALRTGAALDLQPPEGRQDWSPPVSIVEVPREECKGFVLGKAGARMLQFYEELGAIGVFVKEAQAAAAGPSFEVGSLIEAKFDGGSRWFEAKVLELGKSTVKVKWTYDDDVPASDVPLEDCRAHPDAEKPQASEIEVGAVVEAKFGNKDRWFEAIVLRVNDDTVKVKWTYDEDVEPSEVSKSDVKTKPKVASDKLYILGPERGRLEAELKVLNLVESKVPGFVSSSRPQPSEAGDGVGLEVVPLLNDGEMKAKLIGKGGSMRLKLAKVCGVSLEYLGNSAFTVGTRQERTQTAKLLEIVQTSSNGSVEKVPSELEAICTRVTVPQDASFMVTGKQRAMLNQIEEDTGSMTFWSLESVAPPKADAEEKAEFKIEVGKFVQGRFNNRWFEATILSIDDDGVKVRWDYDETEVSTIPASDIREVDGKGKDTTSSSESRVLLIFGNQRSRKLAELRVMAVVETKIPGSYRDFKPPAATDDFAHEVVELGSQEVQRCSDKRLRAVAAAARCVLEQIGDTVHIAGSSSERALAKEYVGWLTAETLTVPEAGSRNDFDELVVPADKRSSLADYAIAGLEKETETLILFEGGPGAKGDAKVFVFGQDVSKRAAALLKLRALQDGSGFDDEDNWGVPGRAEKKVVFVVSKEEEERRRKRAQRFGGEPVAKRR